MCARVAGRRSERATGVATASDRSGASHAIRRNLHKLEQRQVVCVFVCAVSACACVCVRALGALLLTVRRDLLEEVDASCAA